MLRLLDRAACGVARGLDGIDTPTDDGCGCRVRRMYLWKIDIENFRSLNGASLEFRPGLNVILGENNAGKSALIDAIRLVLGTNLGRRDLYPSMYDFYHDGNGQAVSTSFAIHATLAGLSVRESGLFSSCLAPSLGPGIAQIHVRFEQTSVGKRPRTRFSSWGGETEGDSVPPEAFEGIRVIHLEALRDAQVGLRPGRGSRIARLLQLLAPDEAEQLRLTSVVQAANDNIERDELVARAKTEINTRLKGVTGQYLAQTADLKLSQPEFRRITESLRALVGSGQAFEIDENGLGYNNLLYIATVLGELQQAKSADEIDLALLLIEEPESHLHPHLQTVHVDYLDRVGPGPASSPAPNPAGDASAATMPSATDRLPVQVFVTSHSPVLASHAQLDSINLLYFGKDNKISSYALAQCDLSDDEERFLQRFLDVTKAQLFFAKGIIFVEGVSEALLVPEFARGMGYDLGERGVSVVNIQGLAFAPFIKLFQAGAIGIPASVVSDGDPPGDDTFPETLDLDSASDAAKLIAQQRSGMLDVFLAAKTFEYDLALAGNGQRMCEVYTKIRPKKGLEMATALGNAAGQREQAIAFWRNFDLKDKAVFAQQMTIALAKQPEPFTIPAYLTSAIKHAAGV